MISFRGSLLQVRFADLTAASSSEVGGYQNFCLVFKAMGSPLFLLQSRRGQGCANGSGEGLDIRISRDGLVHVYNRTAYYARSTTPGAYKQHRSFNCVQYVYLHVYVYIYIQYYTKRKHE